MMRMDGAGFVQNDVFANAFRMLADPYKFLKNVVIDCHAHYQILANAKYECSERLQMPIQIIRTSCKHFTNEANV